MIFFHSKQNIVISFGNLDLIFVILIIFYTPNIIILSVFQSMLLEMLFNDFTRDISIKTCLFNINNNIINNSSKSESVCCFSV